MRGLRPLQQLEQGSQSRGPGWLLDALYNAYKSRSKSEESVE